MLRKWRYFILIVTLVLLGACGKQEARYIFYFIGDGMGHAQISSAERYLAAMENKSGIIPLAMNLAPATGYAASYSASKHITDSGAAGTALATGYKTSNGTVSMDAEHRYPLKTLAETAKERGMKVGIVTTVDIDHATPAVFYAHQPSRSNYYEIAAQLAYSDFDFFAGGDFRKKKDPKGDSEQDIVDLIKQNGFVFVNNATAFRYLEPGAGRVVFIHPDSNDEYAMPYAIDLDEGSITQDAVLQKAVAMLEGPEGFFIMFEGGKIDWACHANDAKTSILETLAFDDAIKVALEFYNKHRKNTLIVITADHETGGMTMGTSYGDDNIDLSKLKWQTGSFTELTREFSDSRAMMIEQYGEDHVKAHSTWAFDFAEKQTGIGDESKGLGLNEYERSELQTAYLKSFEKLNWKNPYEYILYGGYDPFMMSVSRMLSRKAGIGWTTFSHTAIPLPVRAFGVGAERFNGYYDNTDIPEKILELMAK
mgnify:CR=1 FL=1